VSCLTNENIEKISQENIKTDRFASSNTQFGLTFPYSVSTLNETRNQLSASKNTRRVVEKMGIADRVDAIADGYNVQRPKPAPDIFLFAANHLELEPAQCVVVEDAAVGIEAARAAGMWTVWDSVPLSKLVQPTLYCLAWKE